MLAPSELVWATVLNAIENPRATGKTRPVVLLEASGSLWQTMGLTTNSHYANGSARVAIPNPGRVGLRRPGWLWGCNTTRITSLDITDHIGWADEALILAVI